MSTVGILVNPRSGSDVRRLLTSAGSSTIEDKISILRRVIHGATESGAEHLVLTRDPFSITRRATENLQCGKGEILDLPCITLSVIRWMRPGRCETGVRRLLAGVTVPIGLALGWPDAR